MIGRADSINRLGLAVVGLILGAAGAYGLARSHGVFGTRQKGDPVLLPGISHYAANHHSWFWWAIGAVCVLITLLALSWLRAQLYGLRPANDDLVRSDVGGVTRLHGNAAADALAADIETLPGVASSWARIWGDPATPVVYLRVHVHDDVPVDRLRTRIETETLPRLRRALEVDHVAAHLDLRLAKPEGRSIR